MNVKKILALCAATALVVLVPVGAALAAGGPAVTVRVEGVKRTLLLPTLVRPGSGSITRYGAPKGACSAKSGQGALDVATHHRWRGIWSTQFGPEYEITSILGEAHTFSSKYFWEIFVDHVAATSGACELKVQAGEQLLFAAVPQAGTEYPLGLIAAHNVLGGRSFTVKVVRYNAAGKPKPLAGATVTGRGVHAVTNKRGIATITAPHAGTLVLHADHKGYIRAAPEAVVVS